MFAVLNTVTLAMSDHAQKHVWLFEYCHNGRICRVDFFFTANLNRETVEVSDHTKQLCLNIVITEEPDHIHILQI